MQSYRGDAVCAMKGAGEWKDERESYKLAPLCLDSVFVELGEECLCGKCDVLDSFGVQVVST